MCLVQGKCICDENMFVYPYFLLDAHNFWLLLVSRCHIICMKESHVIYFTMKSWLTQTPHWNDSNSLTFASEFHFLWSVRFDWNHIDIRTDSLTLSSIRQFVCLFTALIWPAHTDISFPFRLSWAHLQVIIRLSSEYPEHCPGFFLPIAKFSFIS